MPGGIEEGSSAVSDDEVVTWWGLVIEGYSSTHARFTAEIQERFGLGTAEFDILLRLVRTPGARMPMTRLARETALSSGGFTKVADRMEKAGLIRRAPSTTDRRVTHATLTPEGERMAARARAASAELVREYVLAPLGEERSAALAATMRMLREANREQA